jgi:hypothetical protein
MTFIAPVAGNKDGLFFGFEVKGLKLRRGKKWKELQHFPIASRKSELVNCSMALNTLLPLDHNKATSVNGLQLPASFVPSQDGVCLVVHQCSFLLQISGEKHNRNRPFPRLSLGL